MKIPSQAKRVFKGVIFDVYQWQQQMFDGTFETFEMIKRPDTIEVIPVMGDTICLSIQSQPTKSDYYSLLGGRAEEGEDPLVTAKRELLEESGLTSDDWELYKVVEPFHKFEWSVYTYIARNCKKTQPQKLDAGEKINLLEVSFDEFIDTVLSKNFWGDELKLELLHMKLDHLTMAAFKKKLFK